MPRFANLKGSMNPFDNNKPVLSSSERLKNKRDKTIYQAQKQHFQSKRKCGNKNVKYYDNGTIRSTNSYKMNMKLSRGAALCQDCDGKGTLCNNSSQDSNRNKIEMGNNSLAEFWGGGGLGWDGTFTFTPSQQPGHIVIQSDVSGVWGPASPPEVSKSDLSGAILPSIPPTLMPYGYITNLIDIPRNLNGVGITIDPSNILFPANICNKLNNLSREELFPYMNLSNLKTYLVIRGGIGIHPFNPSLPIAEGSLASLCNDPSYNNLIGALVIGSPEVDGLINGDQSYFTGVIKHVCCVREQALVYSNGTINAAPSTGLFGPVPKIGIFDLFIELLYTPSNSIFFGASNTLSQLIKESPAPYTNINVADSSVGQIPFTFGWSSFFADAGLIIEPTINGKVTTSVTTYFRALTESIRIFQGSCQANQTIGNDTKQNYMSCLEDKTRKINFTTNDNNTF